MKAGPGQDGADGRAGRDRIYGGNGNDGLSGEPRNDELYGGRGIDRIDGGRGKDICRVGPPGIGQEFEPTDCP